VFEVIFLSGAGSRGNLSLEICRLREYVSEDTLALKRIPWTENVSDDMSLKRTCQWRILLDDIEPAFVHTSRATQGVLLQAVYPIVM
jgi:hypothetical protein